jgi:hypothetical protein
VPVQSNARKTSAHPRFGNMLLDARKEEMGAHRLGGVRLNAEARDAHDRQVDPRRRKDAILHVRVALSWVCDPNPVVERAAVRRAVPCSPDT